MGSGGMIIMDENTCMVDLTRFFLTFTQSESCGECFPCRLGTKQLLSILTRITQGEGKPGDIEKLIEIGTSVKESSLCGLGQSCANPVLSTIQYFRDEFEAHINENRCPAAACDAMVISACQHACPAGIDVPNYVAAIADGDYKKAVEIIRERNPFPAVCGRICVHPCEMKCRRGELDDPVSIRALKRFASDQYYEKIQGRSEPFPVTQDQKVAIVGAGPAGLTCGYFLRKMGYPVTVYEAKDRPGGMLGVTIPEFRLPRQIIDQDIEYIQSCGVEIRYNSPIDRNHTVQDLLKEGYAAVLHCSRGPGIQIHRHSGRGTKAQRPHVWLAISVGSQAGEKDFHGRPRPGYRRRQRGHGRGPYGPKTGRTACSGGVSGEAGRDACLGQGHRRIVGRRNHYENSWGPKQVVVRDGKVSGVEFIRCTSVFDMEGRFRPTYDETVHEVFPCDTLLVSIGQAPDLSFLSEDEGLERAMWGTLQVNENTLATNIPGIFAGGDFTTGPTFVIRAIAAGRRAALAIDKHLRGDDDARGDSR